MFYWFSSALTLREISLILPNTERLPSAAVLYNRHGTGHPVTDFGRVGSGRHGSVYFEFEHERLSRRCFYRVTSLVIDAVSVSFRVLSLTSHNTTDLLISVSVLLHIGSPDTQLIVLSSQCPCSVSKHSNTGSSRVGSGHRVKSHRVRSDQGSGILSRYHICCIIPKTSKRVV